MAIPRITVYNGVYRCFIGGIRIRDGHSRRQDEIKTDIPLSAKRDRGRDITLCWPTDTIERDCYRFVASATRTNMSVADIGRLVHLLFGIVGYYGKVAIQLATHAINIRHHRY